MPRSLTKKFIRMVAHDDAAALLEALGPGIDPRDFHINGDLLPLRCAMYGRVECFMALMAARPDLAEELASLEDGGGKRAIDWLGAHATAPLAQALLAAAPIASSLPSAHGHNPLMDALAHARWDSAELWLAANPAFAKGEPRGRSLAHYLAEPSYETIDAGLSTSWTPAPTPLIHALLDAGLWLGARNSKGYSVLSRAIAQGNTELFDLVLERAEPEDLDDLLGRHALDFSPVHEAAWRDRAGMLKSLAARGADLSELTEKKFSALDIAIRQGCFEGAQLLLSLGAQPDAHPDRSTSAACSAMASADPKAWISWLRDRGVDLEARDDHGSHWAELAWERLPAADAAELWSSLGAGSPCATPNRCWGRWSAPRALPRKARKKSRR